MEKEISLIWQTRTNNSIAKIYQYIAKNDPQNAEDFIRRMYNFGLSLLHFLS
jgi:plasmid stabilization system protein ParE